MILTEFHYEATEAQWGQPQENHRTKDIWRHLKVFSCSFTKKKKKKCREKEKQVI